MMQVFHNHNLLTGACVGAILLGAIVASSLFRNVALAAGAFAAAALYYNNGIDGLLDVGKTVITDVALTHPTFAKGLAVGAILVLVLVAVARERKA